MAEAQLSLHTINEELDQLLLKQVDLIQDYVNLSLFNEREIKDGYFGMARCRYLMGSNALSACTPGTESEMSDDYRLDALVTVITKNNERHLHTGDTSSCADDGDEFKSIRKFGIVSSMSKQSLKTTEKTFRKSLEKLIERANVITQLDLIREQIRALKLCKNQIVTQPEP